MNDASSRSHAILTITLGRGRGAPQVRLVDLAGSERLKRSGAVAGRMSEAIEINSSLLALGRVVSALVELDGKPRAHIPYREAVLTRLLANAIGGRSCTAVVGCVSPAVDSADESASTLRFAARATFVKNDGDDGDKAPPVPEISAEKELALEAAQAEAMDAFGETGECWIPNKKDAIHVFGDFRAGPSAPLVVMIHYYGHGSDG